MCIFHMQNVDTKKYQQGHIGIFLQPLSIFRHPPRLRNKYQPETNINQRDCKIGPMHLCSLALARAGLRCQIPALATQHSQKSALTASSNTESLNWVGALGRSSKDLGRVFIHHHRVAISPH